MWRRVLKHWRAFETRGDIALLQWSVEDLCEDGFWSIDERLKHEGRSHCSSDLLKSVWRRVLKHWRVFEAWGTSDCSIDLLKICVKTGFEALTSVWSMKGHRTAPVICWRSVWRRVLKHWRAFEAWRDIALLQWPVWRSVWRRVLKHWRAFEAWREIALLQWSVEICVKTGFEALTSVWSMRGHRTAPLICWRSVWRRGSVGQHRFSDRLVSHHLGLVP